MIYGLPFVILNLIYLTISLNPDESLLYLIYLFFTNFGGTLIIILFINGIISLDKNISFSLTKYSLIKISSVWFFICCIFLFGNFESNRVKE